MTLNGVIALILRYVTELRALILRKTWRYISRLLTYLLNSIALQADYVTLSQWLKIDL